MPAFVPIAAQAQTTIYKQVDEDGRVIFTDQPRANARTLSSYQTGPRTSARLSDAEVLERVEGQRRMAAPPPPPPPEAHAIAGLYAPMVEPDRKRAGDPEAVFTMPAESPRRSASYDSERARMPEDSSPAVVPRPASAYSSAAGSNPGHVRNSEVERAVFSYAPIASPAAAQVDALEAGRRARQEASKSAMTPVLKVTPVVPERPRVNFKQGTNIYYTVWALTFLLMAAGLLYVGWQVMRLILGEAFPRWHIGAG